MNHTSNQDNVHKRRFINRRPADDLAKKPKLEENILPIANSQTLAETPSSSDTLLQSTSSTPLSITHSSLNSVGQSDLSTLNFSMCKPQQWTASSSCEEKEYACNERIEIVSHISKDTVLYYDKQERQFNVLNDYQSILQFVSKCKTLDKGLSVKCKSAYHIQVEGFARTGKTTLATIILPYLLSKKYTCYSSFRTLVIDCIMEPIDNFHEFFYSYIIEALNLDSSKVERLFSQDVTFWPRFLNRHLNPDTIYFVCLDEVQSFKYKLLTQVKYCLKQGGNPHNLIPILTGSSQTIFLSSIASVNSNGFSLSELRHIYVIPKESSLAKIQDTITAYNTLKQDTVFKLESIQELKTVFGEVLPAHLSFLYYEISSVSDIVNSYEQIYKRDFAFLSKKEPSDEEKIIIKYLLEGDFKKLSVRLRIPVELAYYFEETQDRKYKLRDIILDDIVKFHFKIDNIV